MAKKKFARFTPTVCTCCGQTKDYDEKLSRGGVMVLLAIYHAVRLKGQNRVHFRNEVLVKGEEFSSHEDMVANGKMTATMIDNVLIPKYHGLVAQVEIGSGEYLVTPKGADFLFRNLDVPRVAIIDKATHTKAYYLNETEDRVTFGDIMKKSKVFWDFNEQTRAKLFGENAAQGTLL